MAVGVPARDASLRACGVVGGLLAEVLLFADLLEALVELRHPQLLASSSDPRAASSPPHETLLLVQSYIFHYIIGLSLILPAHCLFVSLLIHLVTCGCIR